MPEITPLKTDVSVTPIARVDTSAVAALFPVVKPKEPIVHPNNTDFLRLEPRPKNETLKKRILSKMLDIDLWLHNKTCAADYDQVKIHKVIENESFEERGLSKDFIASQKYEIFGNDDSITEQRKKYYQLKSIPTKKRAEYLQERAKKIAEKEEITDYDVTKEAIASSGYVDKTKITGKMPIWMSILKNIAYGIAILPFRIKVSLEPMAQSKVPFRVKEYELPQNVGKLRGGELFQFM